MKRVAVVTGANRGIGFEICRQLVKKDINVVLTSRSDAKGRAACKKLRDENLEVDYLPLDVASATSIQSFTQNFQKKFGRCDILINNAGIFPDTKNSSVSDFPSVFEADIDTIRRGMETNVYGPLLLCQALVGLMKKQNYGRMVNISSGMGQLSEMNGSCPGYRISKVGINALTRIMADELQDWNILVNSMCPGWVKTEMGGPQATRSVEEGADTAVWLATLPDSGPRGKFFRDRKEIAW